MSKNMSVLFYLKGKRDDSTSIYISHADNDHFKLSGELAFREPDLLLVAHRGNPAPRIPETRLAEVRRIIQDVRESAPYAFRSYAARAEEVPKLADGILIYVCSPEVLEQTLGDLEEGFRQVAAERGAAAARRWYYWQVARSVVTFVASSLFRLVSLLEALRKLGL